MNVNRKDDESMKLGQTERRKQDRPSKRLQSNPQFAFIPVHSRLKIVTTAENLSDQGSSAGANSQLGVKAIYLQGHTIAAADSDQAQLESNAIRNRTITYQKTY